VHVAPTSHVRLLQQRSPFLPHAAHTLFAQSVRGAVQPTSFAQHAWPSLPHMPFMQPPALQTPCICEHIPMFAMHVPLSP
jgi:hypothetical protein